MKITVLSGSLVLASVAMANPAHNQIANLSEAERLKLFAKALNSSGDSCPSAIRTFYQGGDKNGTAFWNIKCSNGKAYLIQVSNNATGSTKVLDCEVLKRMNAGTCFKPFN